MSIWNPYGFTIGGAPALLGAAPPALRVVGGPATAEQLAAARMTFSQFCAVARTSPVRNPRVVGRLPDGSRYEISVVGPETKMTLWVEAQGSGQFIAWTSFVGAQYLPLWDRPLVDFPEDPLKELPPKPEFNEPFPVLRLAEWGSYYSRTRYIAVGEIGTPDYYRYSEYQTVISWSAPNAQGGFDETVVYASTGSIESYPTAEGIINIFVSAPSGQGSRAENLWDGYQYAGSTSMDGITVTSLAEYNSAAFNAYEAYNVAAREKQEADAAAWNARYLQYQLDLQKWNELKAYLEAGVNGPYEPVLEIRKQARANQLQACRETILAGVSDRHVTARLLSFPYNVAYRSTPPIGAGGAVTVLPDDVKPLEHQRITELHDAQPYAVVPDEGHYLRLDLMPPECLFGWTGNGEFAFAKRFPENHGADPLVIRPPGLEGVSISYSSSYFSEVSLIRDSAAGLVVDADAFVPPGTKLTIVVFEYMVQDPFTGEWVWTPCPELVWNDSIWLRSKGTYVDMPRVQEYAVDMQGVRVLGVFQQTRVGWQEWSDPVELVNVPAWARDFSGIVPVDQLLGTPTAVVIAENLHQAARPSLQQAGNFYRDAAFLWSGDGQAIKSAKALPWQPSETLAPQSQFIVQALMLTRRVPS